jgi:hypothetical protein
MKKAKALHISFNSIDPIILVGDERGGVNSFKLSNSLRKGPLCYIPPKEDDEDAVKLTKIPTSQELE